MFCVSTFNQDISDWDVSNVTNMRQMFYNGSLGVGEYDLSNWDVFNVTNCLYFASIWGTTPFDPNPFWTTQPNFTNCNP
jgi:surface protein